MFIVSQARQFFHHAHHRLVVTEATAASSCASKSSRQDNDDTSGALPRSPARFRNFVHLVHRFDHAVSDKLTQRWRHIDEARHGMRRAA